MKNPLEELKEIDHQLNQHKVHSSPHLLRALRRRRARLNKQVKASLALLKSLADESLQTKLRF